jgi:hypothetical protein
MLYTTKFSGGLKTAATNPPPRDARLSIYGRMWRLAACLKSIGICGPPSVTYLTRDPAGPKAPRNKRPSGKWSDDDFDVPVDGVVVGPIFNANAAPVGDPQRSPNGFTSDAQNSAYSRRSALARRLRLERGEIGLATQPHDAHLVGAIDR